MIVTTSAFNMNAESYKILLKLFKEFYGMETVSAAEFVEEKLLGPTPCSLTDNEIEKFVQLVNHKDFLTAVKDNIVSYYNWKNCNDTRLILIIFVVIFVCYTPDVDAIFALFKDIKSAFKRKVLQYFCDDDNLIQTALAGCKFFEDEYVLNNIINPVLGNRDSLQQVCQLLENAGLDKYPKKPLTVPCNLEVLNRMKKIPAVPTNTPCELASFKARAVPRTVYLGSNIEKKLVGEFEKNRLRAKQLLEEAKRISTKNFSKPKEFIIPEEVAKPKFKAKKAPDMTQNVEIKKNTASVLKEADLCTKENEEEIKTIELALKGGFTLENYKNLVEKTRELEQQEYVQEIERKHLEGLLTFEEAILAKNKVVEQNKERFRQFVEERENVKRKLEQWKEEEQEKLKLLVKKCQDIEKGAKESEKKLKADKKNQVDEIKSETRRMLQEAFERQAEELAKKVKLIEEIKALQQLRNLHVKKFDPTEGSNLGLMYAMSISELQEKLLEVKKEMKRQLEHKRGCIRQHRERKQQMIENVKNYIAQCRMSKPKHRSVPIRPTKLAHSSDLDKLRAHLELVREMRKNKC